VEGPGGNNWITNYGYDALGNLVSVGKCPAQGCSGTAGQNRAFKYDGLSRQIQADNPESGTYYYSYIDTSGNNHFALQNRLDPRGFGTYYSYDGMDRLTGITYQDGTPNASFAYNNLGKLKQSANGNVVNNYTAFDANGRVTASNVQMQGQTYTFSYGYDLAGDLKTETYPSGRVLNTSYDQAQRPLTTNGTAGSTTTPYVQQVGYYPHGAPQYLWYGSNLWSWQSFNSQLQGSAAWADMNNNSSKWMFYAANGFDTNGVVVSQQTGYGPGVAWNSMTFNNDQFQYDFLNRLTSVTDTVYGGSPTNYTRN
jgi:YD repeat-containing protein